MFSIWGLGEKPQPERILDCRKICGQKKSGGIISLCYIDGNFGDTCG